MNFRVVTPLSIFFISASILVLGFTLLEINIQFIANSLITVCTNVLSDLQEHVHFNFYTLLSLLVLATGILGLLLMLRRLVVFLFSYRKLGSHLKSKSISQKLNSIIRKHDLEYISFSIIDSVDSTAYTIGFFKPKIIVSNRMIDTFSFKQLEAVVLHESYHVRHFHMWLLLFSKLISSLLFFVPVIEVLVQKLILEFELAADAFVIETQRTKSHLCSSLALSLTFEDGVALQFATPPITQRIEYLVSGSIDSNKIDLKKMTVSVVTVASMFLLFVFNPSRINADLRDLVCSDSRECQTNDCVSHYESDKINFSPAILFSPRE